MTATATAAYPAPCPKCGGEMYDNRGTKKNPKQPDAKCKRYKEGCEGVFWPPKNGAPPIAKAQSKPASFANKPEGQLDPLLRDEEAIEEREWSAKVGIDLTKFSKDLALYQGLTEWVAGTIAPIYTKAKIGMSPESAAAAVATLYIQAKRTP